MLHQRRELFFVRSMNSQRQSSGGTASAARAHPRAADRAQPRRSARRSARCRRNRAQRATPSASRPRLRAAKSRMVASARFGGAPPRAIVAPAWSMPRASGGRHRRAPPAGSQKRKSRDEPGRPRPGQDAVGVDEMIDLRRCRASKVLARSSARFPATRSGRVLDRNCVPRCPLSAVLACRRGSDGPGSVRAARSRARDRGRDDAPWSDGLW